LKKKLCWKHNFHLHDTTIAHVVGGELVFLPLVELLWETLVRKGLPQTLGKQLRHFVEQMNLENFGSKQGEGKTG